MIYRIAIPITYEELQSKIPQYETMPIWWDNECYLFYWNIWGNIYYMHPNSQGVLTNNRKYRFYDRKMNPEFVIEKRKYWEYLNETEAEYYCPNCDTALVPYDYDFLRTFACGQHRQRFCNECGYPILWY